MQRLFRLRSERRCDCLACFGRRLATTAFLIGLAALLLLAGLLHAAEPFPLLIDAEWARPSVTNGASPEIPIDPVARAKFPRIDHDVIDVLADVNRTVNHAIARLDDERHYGAKERWLAWPADGKGDCEDIALSKMELLGNIDFPLTGNAILITVAVHHAGTDGGHAIVQLRLPDGAFMYLDSNFDEPMTRRELVAHGYQFFDWTDR
jgi:predicted transglutaminase-like cysteine proteinase